MPRFYLHMCNGNGFAEDVEGLELADEAAARKAAIAGLRDVTAGDLAGGEFNLGSFIEIENERHELVATISFEDAVQVREEHARAISSGRWPTHH
jgi:hypothetical protein